MILDDACDACVLGGIQLERVSWPTIVVGLGEWVSPVDNTLARVTSCAHPVLTALALTIQCKGTEPGFIYVEPVTGGTVDVVELGCNDACVHCSTLLVIFSQG